MGYPVYISILLERNEIIFSLKLLLVIDELIF